MTTWTERSAPASTLWLERFWYSLIKDSDGFYTPEKVEAVVGSFTRTILVKQPNNFYYIASTSDRTIELSLNPDNFLLERS